MVHTVGQIQNISIMRIIDIYYTAFYIVTQTVAPTIPGFQGLNHCIQYLASHPHKPIFYTYIYYDGSNVIRIIWGGNQVKYYISKNCLECHQNADHSIFLNIRCFVLGIIHTLLGVAVC